MLRHLITTTLCVAAAASLICSEAAEEKPNIVWINCEDLDEVLGCYGYAQAITPHLDALARESILYRQAFANAPICAPARSCLMTGVYPTSLGSQHLRCAVTLPDFIEPLPAMLQDGGYFTTNYAKTDYNFSPEGLYDYWEKDLAPWRKRKDADQPFFSFLVFGSTHEGPGNDRTRYETATADLPASKRHDPDKAQVPPYFPASAKMRELWARYDDLVSAMDEQVGEVIAGLKEDKLWDNTIVWFYSDHGHGLPRHKRWLLDSGLRVPLLVRIPPKFQHLAASLAPGSESDELVSFIDYAPTVLSQAGLPIPKHMPGRAFLGKVIGEPHRYLFGARDRADDMYEVSRSVHDGRFIYVRHFLPHLPYIQTSIINGNQKESMAELRRARDSGELTGAMTQLWARRKPVEEFYDLHKDPHEIHNLATDPNHAVRIAAMRRAMENWIAEHRDTGFLHEAEYHRRANDAGKTIYEMAHDPSHYDLESIYAAASGTSKADLSEMLESPDAGVRYWGCVRFLAQEQKPDHKSLSQLKSLRNDESASVAIAAAEVLCMNGQGDFGLPVLTQQAANTNLIVALQAARALVDIGQIAKPIVIEMESIRKQLEGTEERRRYRDFNYASFTGWALEAALIQCGAAQTSNFR